MLQSLSGLSTTTFSVVPHHQQMAAVPAAQRQGGHFLNGTTPSGKLQQQELEPRVSCCPTRAFRSATPSLGTLAPVAILPKWRLTKRDSTFMTYCTCELKLLRQHRPFAILHPLPPLDEIPYTQKHWYTQLHRNILGNLWNFMPYFRSNLHKFLLGCKQKTTPKN